MSDRSDLIRAYAASLDRLSETAMEGKLEDVEWSWSAWDVVLSRAEDLRAVAQQMDEEPTSP